MAMKSLDDIDERLTYLEMSIRVADTSPYLVLHLENAKKSYADICNDLIVRLTYTEMGIRLHSLLSRVDALSSVFIDTSKRTPPLEFRDLIAEIDSIVADGEN